MRESVLPVMVDITEELAEKDSKHLREKLENLKRDKSLGISSLHQAQEMLRKALSRYFINADRPEGAMGSKDTASLVAQSMVTLSTIAGSSAALFQGKDYLKALASYEKCVALLRSRHETSLLAYALREMG